MKTLMIKNKSNDLILMRCTFPTTKTEELMKINDLTRNTTKKKNETKQNSKKVV